MNDLQSEQNLDLETASEVTFEAVSESTKHVVITIHGTGDSAMSDIGDKWWQRGSGWTDKLQAEAMTDPNSELRPFVWNGENSQQSRVDAGADLAKTIKSLPPGTDYSVIAHSHGGNVLLYALSMAAQARSKLRSAVLVGTPLLGERANSLSFMYVIAAIAIIIVGLFASVPLIDQFTWIDISPVIFVPALVVFYAFALWFSFWATSKSKRFSRISFVFLIGILVSFTLNSLEINDIYPFVDASDPLEIYFIMAFSGSYSIACFLIAIRMLRGSVSTFWRESRKRKMLQQIGDKISLLAHPQDEAIGLLRGITNLRLDLASPDQMARSLAVIFTRILFLASFIAIIFWFVYDYRAYQGAVAAAQEQRILMIGELEEKRDDLNVTLSQLQTENAAEQTDASRNAFRISPERRVREIERDIAQIEDRILYVQNPTPPTHWSLYIVVPLFLFTPFYLGAQALSGLMGGALGRWTASRLNNRITQTASSAAMGDDTQHRLEFDTRARDGGLNRPVLSNEAAEQMMTVACDQAAETATQLIRKDIAAQVSDGQFMKHLKEIVTFREFLHCGYFDNDLATRQIFSLLNNRGGA